MSFGIPLLVLALALVVWGVAYVRSRPAGTPWQSAAASFAQLVALVCLPFLVLALILR